MNKHHYLPIALSLVVAGLLLSGLFALQTRLSKNAIAASVVAVLSADRSGGGTGWVALTKDGQKVIVTNAHVCDVAEGGRIVIVDDAGGSYVRNVLDRDAEHDLCTISGDGISAPHLRLAKSSPERFDPVFVMGHPLLEPTSPAAGFYVQDRVIPLAHRLSPDGTCETGQYTESMFGAFCVTETETSYSTAMIYPGNSGSPVTNENGEVVGVINAGNSQTHFGLYIPLPYVSNILGHK